MADREKLIELIEAGERCPDDHDPFGTCEGCRYFDVPDCHTARIADHLIANGVTVLTPDEAKNIYTVQEIEEIQGEAYDLGAESILHNHFGLSWNDAAEVRKEVAKLQATFRWIPVTERLPDGECLAISMVRGHSYKEMLVGYIGESANSETGYICESEGEILQNVTHWKQPEPPKEETK